MLSNAGLSIQTPSDIIALYKAKDIERMTIVVAPMKFSQRNVAQRAAW